MDRAKKPFDVPTAMRHLRSAVEQYPKAAMFELADEGFTSVFQQLISCIISIRTYEEVTLAASRRLFAVARTPAEIAALSPERVDELIHPCTFHFPKSRQILAIAKEAAENHAGILPADMETLLQFAGVGPKCANLALGVSTGQPTGIPVDIHVHRVVNRWGIVAARTPEQTMEQLQAILPKRYWLEINKLLVPFGRNVCRSPKPKCPHCSLLSMCRQVGVEAVDPTPPNAGSDANPAQKRRRAVHGRATDISNQLSPAASAIAQPPRDMADGDADSGSKRSADDHQHGPEEHPAEVMKDVGGVDRKAEGQDDAEDEGAETAAAAAGRFLAKSRRGSVVEGGDERLRCEVGRTRIVADGVCTSLAAKAASPVGLLTALARRPRKNTLISVHVTIEFATGTILGV